MADTLKRVSNAEKRLMLAIKKKTYADKLRSMNDEALAAELLYLFAAFYDVEWSIENILDFLQQEVE